MSETPKVLDNLTDEEAALWAILSDPSGLDQAEFLWTDPSAEDNLFCPHCDTNRNGVHVHDHDELSHNDWIEKYPAPSMCFRAWAYQWPWWRDRSPLSIDQCARSVGKALDVATQIPTPNGWRSLGELEVNDVVYDETGTPTSITAAFDVLDHRPCFEVVFDDGSTIVADADHQWLTWDALAWKAANRGRTGTPKVRTTTQIARTLRHGREANHRVPVTAVLKGTRRTPDISPYVLGYWLGDGDSTQAALTVGAMDIEEVSALLASEGYSLTKMAGPRHYKLSESSRHTEWEYATPTEPRGRSPKRGTLNNGQVQDLRQRAHDGEPLLALAGTYGVTAASVTQLVRGQTRRNAGGWIRGDLAGSEVAEHLRHLGVMGNKHVPDDLLRASSAERLALLQGLMDSDGHIRDNGRCEITLKNERLARNVRELATTLGQRVFFEKRSAECNGVDAGPVYRVGFKPLDLQPFRLQRKASKVAPGSTRTRNKLRTRRIIDVREVPSRPVRCISVDSPNHLYLAGEAMIPTHNSLSIKVRGCAFPFLFPGQEMIITAPELVHLEPIVSLIESQMFATRTLRELLPRGKSAVTHRPFQMNFLNGARIIGRIPQRDGKGVKGIHPIWLELDEAQDYPHAGWVELRETLKRGFGGAMLRAHGVTKGVRDDFYEVTQDTPDNKWRVHRFAAMWRPNWTDVEREEAILKYGSREDPDYRRNVLGLHGDKTNPIFVLTQLMKCVDSDKLSDYNADEYFLVNVKSEQLELFEQEITDVLDFPRAHLAYVGKNLRERTERPKAIFWVGMDIGFTIDPSEILVFVEHRPKANSDHKVLRLLTRISMTRMPHREQIQAIMHTIDFYRPKAFAMDKAGNGLTIFQEMSEHFEAFRRGDRSQVPAWMQRYDLNLAVTAIKGYNFSEKLLVDFDPAVETSPYDSTSDLVAKAGMKRNAKEYATDVLRELVDRQGILLPWDDDLLKQFQGGTWTSNRSMDAYGRRIFSRGNDHVLDAARMAALGWSQYSIEELTKEQAAQPVLDVAITF